MRAPPSCAGAVPVSYQLFIELRQPARLVIGHLGLFDFPAGSYVYTGSARRGLEARLRRHLAAHKRLHWHIDYLLGASHVCFTRVSPRRECEWNQMTGGSIVVPGFGSTDCRAGCGSHLKYLGALPELPAIMCRT